MSLNCPGGRIDGMTAPCAVYDFRMNAEGLSEDSIISCIKQLAKHYIFQEEKGESTGYLHYQGRMSLIKKARKPELMKLWEKIGLCPIPNYLEPTANPPKVFDYDCYASKAASRTRGPWTDKEKPIYIPRQYRGKLDTLYPFQKFIFDTATQFDDRIINLIYCPKGNQGKSTIASICELYGKGIDLPPVNDADRLIQSCCDICISKDIRDPSPIFIDMPRAMNKERLNGIYTAIEQIKKGKLYDLRYTYKEYWIDSPQIWVFSNIEPDLSMLSLDRWRVWSIDGGKNLVRYEPEDKFNLDDPLEKKS